MSALTNAVQRPKTSAEFARLKSEAERLRFNFLRTELELSYTIARLPEAKPTSLALQEISRNIASQGYQAVLKHWPKDQSPERDELESKLNLLKATLEGSDALEPPPAAITNAHKNATNGFTRELTSREIEVLKLIAEGYSTKQLAGKLGITFKTASCHRQRIMEKLSIHDTARLVRYAIRAKLIQA